MFWKQYLKKYCEPCFWDWRYNPKVNNVVDAFNMGSMLGSSEIFDFIKNKDNKCRVMLSGIGADEIMARNFFILVVMVKLILFPKN